MRIHPRWIARRWTWGRSRHPWRQGSTPRSHARSWSTACSAASGDCASRFLAEPDIAPELDIPLWRFLSDNAPDWLLPGAGDIPPDRVLAVQTNPAFVDAVLVGANEQTLGELRWRNLPITTRWTPLRRFWQRINVGAGEVATDIRPVVALDTDQPLWPDATELGDVSHLADPTHGANLVVVLHTELFRRYPSTIVYLVPIRAAPTSGATSRTSTRPGDPSPDYPSFSGTLTPELVFFGFGVPPAAGRDHWLVLEEPPPGYRFRHPAAEASADGAVFAENDVRAAGPRLPGEPAVTARRDEVQTARDARRAGQVLAAQIAAELSSLPGWLLVGDSARLVDPAQQSTAEHGAELLARFGDTQRGLLALDEELDALDGARPDSIHLFLEWSRWLGQVPDAATLLAELVPDPRRLFLGAEPRMTQATAQRIVDTVAANGGRVGDGDTFVHGAGLADDDVFDLYHTALTRLDPIVAGQAVGVLLPLRLETRFRHPNNGGQWMLRVRVYPDPVALAPPAPTPTPARRPTWSRPAGPRQAATSRATRARLRSARWRAPWGARAPRTSCARWPSCRGRRLRRGLGVPASRPETSGRKSS